MQITMVLIVVFFNSDLKLLSELSSLFNHGFEKSSMFVVGPVCQPNICFNLKLNQN